MKTRLLIGAAVIVAAVPAVIGLWGNASFSQDVPVRIPASGQIVPLSPAPTATPSDSPTPSASPSEGLDDHGGETPRDQRTEPGDDRDVQGGVTVPGSTTEPGDDNGGSSHGGDDSGADDHGGSGHGSDD